ncbi:MAG: FAD-binding oxidoreductase [Candidatus Nanopelagicales bacterium]|nr:FAD-binding oxidoreductase [Candidatus Nanopelagicales bacterium]
MCQAFIVTVNPDALTPDRADRFTRWGRPIAPVALSGPVQHFLEEHVGLAIPAAAVPVVQSAVPQTRLTPTVIAELNAAVGQAQVLIEPMARLLHSRGMSYVDMMQRRAADTSCVPDAVVQPASHDEVLAVLGICVEHQIAVVPYGGGTSVVGGVTRPAGTVGIVISLERLREMIDLDEVSGLVRVQPGMTGPVLERLLDARGFTLGHLPQSWERATIGGYAATRSAGQASSGYGRIDDMIEAVTLATPVGTWSAGQVPASAAGPNLLQLAVGSEGVFGVITEITLRVRRTPKARHYEGAMAPSFAAGVAACRELAQLDLTGAVVRLSDEAETVATLAISGPTGARRKIFDRYLSVRGVSEGALLILGWEEHSTALLDARRDAAWGVLKKFGVVSIGRGVGASWEHGRYSGPYLRDTLLDDGYLVETFETAGAWVDLLNLHEVAKGAALGALTRQGHTPYVMTHLSHVYETGASLYFTVIDRGGPDSITRWISAKKVISAALQPARGTITHHHAIGRDHEPWLAAEIGPIGMGLLQALKAELDPTGIMNPGVFTGFGT